MHVINIQNAGPVQKKKEAVGKRNEHRKMWKSEEITVRNANFNICKPVKWSLKLDTSYKDFLNLEFQKGSAPFLNRKTND